MYRFLDILDANLTHLYKRSNLSLEEYVKTIRRVKKLNQGSNVIIIDGIRESGKWCTFNSKIV